MGLEQRSSFGDNTYSGITTINAGVLSISQDANLGSPPSAPVANQLTLNGGTLQATASFALNANRGITLVSGEGLSTERSTLPGPTC